MYTYLRADTHVFLTSNFDLLYNICTTQASYKLVSKSWQRKLLIENKTPEL